jgi:hypothetical protein
MKLLENPPDRLHELRVESLVIIFKIDSPAHSGDGLLPLFTVAHDNAPTLLIVIGNSEIQNVLLRLDIQFAIDLEFHRESMAIPTAAPGDMMPRRRLEPSHDVLDSPLYIIRGFLFC